MDKENVQVGFEDIIRLSNGLDNYGYPRSAATISVDKVINEEDTENISNVELTGAEINIFSSGGCAIVQVDFPPTSLFAFNKSKDMCDEWFNNFKENVEDNKFLMMTIIPSSLIGQLILMYNNLVYYQVNELPKGNRLVLAFDNNATQVLESEGFDYIEIINAVNSELREEEEELNNELDLVEQELKEIESKNIYAENVIEKYGKVDYNVEDVLEQEDDSNRKTETNKSSFFRFTKED